ncbi:hypothetical protein BRD56_04490 [Thermoplasmatales archaeon SW_10_69_26]|nr:MAG: hypothetical protein BRD56_04490 [Thermoplasmatales archaeon SW_10_69_26]
MGFPHRHLLVLAAIAALLVLALPAWSGNHTRAGSGAILLEDRIGPAMAASDAPIVTDDAIVYAFQRFIGDVTTNGPGAVLAYDRAEGQRTWQMNTTADVAGIVEGPEGSIVLTTRGDANDTRALDPATGQVRWNTTLGSLGYRSAPVARDDLLAVSDESGTVHLLDPGTGEVTDTTETGPRARLAASPERVVAVHQEWSDADEHWNADEVWTHVVSIGPEGDIVRRNLTEGRPVGQPVLASGQLYLATESSYHVLAADTLGTLSSGTVPNASLEPVGGDGDLFVAGDGDIFTAEDEEELTLIRPGGNETRTSLPIPHPYGAPPVREDSVLVAPSRYDPVTETSPSGTAGTGGMHAYDLDAGEAAWHVFTGGVNAPPTIEDGILAFATAKGEAYAIDAGVGPPADAEARIAPSPLSPTTVTANATFDLTFAISNTGTIHGEGQASLLVDGEVIDRWNVSLYPGESTTLRAENLTAPSQPGEYRLTARTDLGSADSRLTVEPAQTQEPTPEENDTAESEENGSPRTDEPRSSTPVGLEAALAAALLATVLAPLAEGRRP